MNIDQKMMENITALSGIAVQIFEKDHSGKGPASNTDPLYEDDELLNLLVNGCEKQKIPFLYRDPDDIFFSAINCGGKVCLIGPVCFRPLRPEEIHRFYYQHGCRGGEEKPIPLVSLSSYLAALSLAAFLLTDEIWEGTQILEANPIPNDSTFETGSEDIEQEYPDNINEKNEHHTWQEEHQFLRFIRDGKTEEALRSVMTMDRRMGRMASNDLSQWRKIAAIDITLSGRAAIESGLPPSAVYTLSEDYLCREELCRTPAALMKLRNAFVQEITEKVKIRGSRKAVSSYSERCCEYIRVHIREKIRIADIASSLDISPSHLSHLFSDEMKMSVQSYIQKQKMENAQEQLVYTDKSLSEIAYYLGYPSQSYFTTAFRKACGMTPREYRDKNRPRE